MRRRDLLIALAITPAALVLPGCAKARKKLEGGAAVETVPLVRAFWQGEPLGRHGGLTIHAVPREGTAIRKVTFELFCQSEMGLWIGEDKQAPILLGPENRVPVNPAEGEYYADLRVPWEAIPGFYFLRWRVETEDGQVTEVEHPFSVTERLTRLYVTYDEPELSTDFLRFPETPEEIEQFDKFCGLL